MSVETKKTSAADVAELQQRADRLEQLLSLMVESTADDLVEKKQKKELQQRKRAAAQRSSAEEERSAKEAIRRCPHLKGMAGAGRTKGAKVDYAFAIHTFADNSVRVKCIAGCPFAVWGNRVKAGIPDDTATTLYRPNHGGTAGYFESPNASVGSKNWPGGLGFVEALDLANEWSSNKQSLSERIIDQISAKKAAEVERMREELDGLKKQLATFKASE